ncbi:MAG: phage tail tape measure protein, partial [Cetobacterium sp.]
MSEIEIKVDLDLDSKKAKEKLNDFKQLAEKEDIKVKLDLDNAKSEALQLKNVLSDAFKLDKATLGNLKQVESSLKEINKLLKAQSNLSKPGSSKGLDLGIDPISINKNADIVKDINVLVGDYKKATEQLEDLDAVGKSMKAALDGFNEDQEQAFRKFSQDSKRYDTYLKDLEGDNLTSTLKKAIASRKKAIELQEQLTKSGVVKVNNDQIRNEKSDGSMFTIENEKWKAMFAKSESEAKDLEDMARKLKPQIDRANSTVEELVKKMSDDERKLLDTISKAYEQRPQFDRLSSGMDNDNASILKMYLEGMMPDVDKMGLDFNNLDDIFRGLDRYYSRLEQMQKEYNTKFAGEDGFKPMRMDSLMDIEQDQVKKIINEAEQNNNLLENIFKDRNKLGTINNDNLTVSGVNESELKHMEEFIRLSKLMNQSMSKSTKQNSLTKEVNDYISATKKINDLQAQLYKSDANGTSDISKSIQNEIDLMRQKQLASASMIRSNRDLYESVRDQIRIEEQLSNARRATREVTTDTKSLNELNKAYQELDKIQDKLTSMQNTKGFLDNAMIEKTNSLLAETRTKLDANGIESDFREIGTAINSLENNLKNLNSGNTLSRQEASFNVSLQNMENKLESFKESIKGLRGSEDVVERLEAAFRGIDTSNLERATVDLRQFGNELQQVQREMRQLESGGRTFFGNFGQEFRENLFTFTAGELLADGIRNVGYALKTVVMEYDTAMTNLKKVADPSDIMNIEQLDAIQNKAIGIAKNVGQSSQDTIQAIADTIQMSGLGMEASIMVAEQTMKLANVAEMTQEAASKGVVTMLSAFNLDPMKEVPLVVNGVTQSVNEMTNAMDIVNHVGNNFAVSSDGIIDAITSGANVLSAYGVSLEDTVAMITGANTTLQDTSRVGNGLKTIAINLAGIKASADTGELSLNKTAKTLQEVAKIDIFADDKQTQIKDMAVIMDELAVKWDGFNDPQKAGIAEAIAGKNQAAVFQSLMQNFDTVRKVQEELGSGKHFQSMEKENAQYIDSIAGKLNTLKETWVGIFNTIFSSDATKSIIDGLIAISEAISNVITMLDETKMLTPVLMMLGTMLASKAFTGLPNLFRGGERSARSFSNILPSVAEGLGNFGLMGTRAGVALYGVQGALGAAGTATSGFLATAATFIPWAVGGAVALGGLIWAVDHFTESLDEEKERLNETISTRKQEIASMDEQKSKLQAIQKEYDALADKPKKTAKEVERLNELTKQIAEIRPDLVVAYDENNNPILSMTGDVKDLIEEMDRATESKKRLLSVEQEDLAKNSIKQLHGSSSGGRLEQEGYRPDTEMNRLEDLTSQHVTKMMSLEAKRDKILNKMYNSTGKERQQLLKDLEKANYNIEKQQSDFSQNYQQQLDVIKEYSDTIGEGLFASLENGSVFKNMDEEMQKAFSGIRQSLDFTDIKTEDQLLEVEMSLN